MQKEQPAIHGFKDDISPLNFESPQRERSIQDHPMSLKELQSASSRSAQIKPKTNGKVTKPSDDRHLKSSVKDNVVPELPESIRRVKEEIKKKIERFTYQL